MNQAMKQRVSYMYRMKGHGENWNKVNGNYIYFNELPSGNYTLEVKAVAPGGWSSEISTVQIVVKPPFWLSIPALILYGLLALGALWLYILKLKKKQKKTMEVQKMEMELAQQYEMEEKKIKFFTNISHDLKTPLSLVIAPLEKVLSGNIDKSVRTELNMAWKNAKLLLDEITQLLDFRRLDVGSEKLYKSHGDMVSLVQKLVQGFNYFSENRNIHTNLRINVQSLEMDFDENKMRRIINNLLSNAYKYNKEKGTVNVTLGVRHQDGRKMMELQVADTGKGISDEHKEHIFKRFYQESNDGEYIGSGIGLHIVKEYVNMHGGEVTVKDNHPEGSIFVVTIPIDEEQQVKDERLMIQEEGAEQRLMDKSENTEKTGQENSRTTILVVEDNFDSRHFLERSLNDDYEILTASNGKEALDIMKDHDVNLVISDVMMPVMNGLELCNRIKTDVNYSHIPVILLTAKSTEDNIMAGLRDGADEYITKPYNLNILKLRIKKILEWTDEVHQRIANGIEIEPSKITVSSVDEELISKAIRLVEENMQDGNFSVSELSSAIGMTRGHLYKKMMAITGKSPVEFIRILKIKRGRSLLEQGKTNISEVAYAVGYSSKQFSKYFKDEYGCLPSEFLKRNRQTTN
jgi:signal transduction histidine kinase/DNA-binding response OmpR family regulator